MEEHLWKAGAANAIGLYMTIKFSDLFSREKAEFLSEGGVSEDEFEPTRAVDSIRGTCCARDADEDPPRVQRYLPRPRRCS